MTGITTTSMLTSPSSTRSESEFKNDRVTSGYPATKVETVTAKVTHKNEPESHTTLFMRYFTEDKTNSDHYTPSSRKTEGVKSMEIEVSAFSTITEKTSDVTKAESMSVKNMKGSFYSTLLYKEVASHKQPTVYANGKSKDFTRDAIVGTSKFKYGSPQQDPVTKFVSTAEKETFNPSIKQGEWFGKASTLEVHVPDEDESGDQISGSNVHNISTSGSDVYSVSATNVLSTTASDGKTTATGDRCTKHLYFFDSVSSVTFHPEIIVLNGWQ